MVGQKKKLWKQKKNFRTQKTPGYLLQYEQRGVPSEPKMFALPILLKKIIFNYFFRCIVLFIYLS